MDMGSAQSSRLYITVTLLSPTSPHENLLQSTVAQGRFDAVQKSRRSSLDAGMVPVALVYWYSPPVNAAISVTHGADGCEVSGGATGRQPYRDTMINAPWMMLRALS